MAYAKDTGLDPGTVMNGTVKLDVTNAKSQGFQWGYSKLNDVLNPTQKRHSTAWKVNTSFVFYQIEKREEKDIQHKTHSLRPGVPKAYFSLRFMAIPSTTKVQKGNK